MRALGVVLAGLVLLPLEAMAAGFYAGEIGARGLGRGGADVVRPSDGFAIWRNPAALALQEGGSVGLESTLGWLNLSYDRTGPFAGTGYERDLAGHRITVGDHVEVDPTDIGLDAGDDWRVIYETGNYPSQGQVENRASPFILDCSELIGGGFDGRGHCPIVNGTVVLGERAHQIPGLTLALGGYGPPTGGYWFWDESLATDPSLPEEERYIDERGLDKRFTGPQRYILIDRDVVEAFYQFSAAYKLSRWLAVGFGLQAVESSMRQRLAISADTLGTEDPNMDTVIEIAVHQAYIPSGNIGFWSNPWGGLELGLSYQLPRPVVASGPIRVDYTAPGLDGYVIDDTDGMATVRFNMPAIARLGARYRFDPWFDVELAYVLERWSTWKVTLIEIEGVSFSLPGMDPIGFAPVAQAKDYQDSHGVRLGSDLDPLATIWPGHVTLRGGVFFETSAVPTNTLDVSVIDANKVGVAGGIEFRYAGLRLAVAYQHSFLADTTVDNTLAMVVAPVGEILGYETRTAAANGTYRASFDILTVGLGVDFMETVDHFTGADANEG